MEVVMEKAKLRVLIVGGLPHNVPDALDKLFNVVGHVTQDQDRVGQLPKADYILVISDWAAHSVVKTAKQQTGADVIWVRKGWNAMKAELIRRGLMREEAAVTGTGEGLPNERSSVAETPSPAPEPPPAPNTSGLSTAELWAKYGGEIIHAAYCFEPGVKMPVAYAISQIAELVGIPEADVQAVVERLAMKGVLVLDGSGKCWLAAAPGKSYESDSTDKPKAATEEATIPEKMLKIVAWMKGLPMGPYSSKASLIQFMAQFREFRNMDGSPVSHDTGWRRIQAALKLRVAEEHHGKLFIDHDPSVTLTRMGKEANRA